MKKTIFLVLLFLVFISGSFAQQSSITPNGKETALANNTNSFSDSTTTTTQTWYGTWVKWGGFTQLNVGCSQTWTCDCGSYMAASDCHLSKTDDYTTYGVCDAGGGDVGSCNYCTANEPNFYCKCTLTCPDK